MRSLLAGPARVPMHPPVLSNARYDRRDTNQPVATSNAVLPDLRRGDVNRFEYPSCAATLAAQGPL